MLHFALYASPPRKLFLKEGMTHHSNSQTRILWKPEVCIPGKNWESYVMILGLWRNIFRFCYSVWLSVCCHLEFCMFSDVSLLVSFLFSGQVKLLSGCDSCLEVICLQFLVSVYSVTPLSPLLSLYFSNKRWVTSRFILLTSQLMCVEFSFYSPHFSDSFNLWLTFSQLCPRSWLPRACSLLRYTVYLPVCFPVIAA